MSEHALLDLVRESGMFVSDDEAERTIQATLEALGACLSAGERRAIAAHLPEHYASTIREAGSDRRKPLELDAFVDHVRSEARITHPRVKIQTVLAGLNVAVGEGELADARDQLPPEYGELFEPATIEPEKTFVDVVADMGGLDAETAEMASREVLSVLGHRLSKGEASDLAPYLWGEASEWLSQTATHDAEDFSAEEFVARVADRADVSELRARAYIAAVADALVEVVPEEERDRAEAQLPAQYAGVLDLDD